MSSPTGSSPSSYLFNLVPLHPSPRLTFQGRDVMGEDVEDPGTEDTSQSELKEGDGDTEEGQEHVVGHEEEN